MKHHLIASYHTALRDDCANFAASLAALYAREYGKPPPSQEAAAVKVFLDSSPPFDPTNNHQGEHLMSKIGSSDACPRIHVPLI